MSILVLSLSHIPSDPRVHKTCVALQVKGYAVTAIGFSGKRDLGTQQEMPYTLRTFPSMPHGLMYRMGMVLRQFPANLWPALASFSYWRDAQVRAMWSCVKDLKPKIIYANDLNTLPLAVALKLKTGAKLIYDTHEFAVAEGGHRLVWRLLFQVYRKTMEGRALPHVDQVISVSEGIAHALQHLYQLATTPLTVRNVPPFEMIAPRNISAPYTVLYHGLYLKDRGLEALIESVPLWHEDYALCLRGYGAVEYEKTLKEKALRLAPSRITFAPPVSTHELVKAAASADIGILPFPTTGIQKEFSLPNKLFEYLMAGLAVVSTPCRDISAHLVRYHVGVTTNGESPQAIADTINAMSYKTLVTLRENALIAAQDLCWEREQGKMLDRVEKLYS
jgi:glycogen synthase